MGAATMDDTETIVQNQIAILNLISMITYELSGSIPLMAIRGERGERVIVKPNFDFIFLLAEDTQSSCLQPEESSKYDQPVCA